MTDHPYSALNQAVLSFLSFLKMKNAQCLVESRQPTFILIFDKYIMSKNFNEQRNPLFFILKTYSKTKKFSRRQKNISPFPLPLTTGIYWPFRFTTEAPKRLHQVFRISLYPKDTGTIMHISSTCISLKNTIYIKLLLHKILSSFFFFLRHLDLFSCAYIRSSKQKLSSTIIYQLKDEFGIQHLLFLILILWKDDRRSGLLRWVCALENEKIRTLTVS